MLNADKRLDLVVIFNVFFQSVSETACNFTIKQEGVSVSTTGVLDSEKQARPVWTRRKDRPRPRLGHLHWATSPQSHPPCWMFTTRPSARTARCRSVLENVQTQGRADNVLTPETKNHQEIIAYYPVLLRTDGAFE